MGIEFQKYPSISRYRKPISITEKVDGTNAAIGIVKGMTGPECRSSFPEEDYGDVMTFVGLEDETFTVYAQSRNRLITPDKDNHGFARFVWDNALELVKTLGEGIHYGEWWGSGIQRGYGLAKGEKHFTVFNPERYDLIGQELVTAVPVLYTGPAYLPYTPAATQSNDAVEYTMHLLKQNGSSLPFAKGFDNPEGVVVFHTASRTLYKVTYEYDEGKWSAAV
jgi:RNA ligase